MSKNDLAMFAAILALGMALLLCVLVGVQADRVDALEDRPACQHEPDVLDAEPEPPRSWGPNGVLYDDGSPRRCGIGQQMGGGR